jgi:hypothetical protein
VSDSENIFQILIDDESQIRTIPLSLGVALNEIRYTVISRVLHLGEVDDDPLEAVSKPRAAQLHRWAAFYFDGTRAFSSSVQWTTTLMGSESVESAVASLIMRNRWPSGDTS